MKSSNHCWSEPGKYEWCREIKGINKLQWKKVHIMISEAKVALKRGVPSAESSRSVRGLGKGVSGKPYPRLCNARRPRLEPETFRSLAVRLYRLHQAHPSIFLQD